MPSTLTTTILTRAGGSEERFRLLIESVKDYAIFILDPQGHISTWNPGAERIKGYTADEIIGKHFSIFYPASEIATGKCEFELDVATREGRFEEEGWRLRKDSTRFWANVTITALRDPTGTLVGFAKVTQDLTQRQEVEQNKRALAAQGAALAEKARIQEFQERFLGILGHDLRNPLASIDMGVGILRQRETDPTASRILARMQASSMRMARMIEQILDLTRSRLAGGLQLSVQPMDLRDVITTIVDELRVAHPGRVIEVLCSSLPGTWDRDRLEQVFSNLIGNALLHGDPAEAVTVEARRKTEGDGQADAAVVVDVHNEGPPIPEALQAKIFDPFRRGERESRTSKTAGLGLGLFISHEVVLAHGGRIDVQSTSTKGTTFRVILPRDFTRNLTIPS